MFDTLMEDQVNIIHDGRAKAVLNILCSMFFAYVVFFKVRLDTHASSLLLKYIPGYIRKLHKILTAGNEFGPAVN